MIRRTAVALFASALVLAPALGRGAEVPSSRLTSTETAFVEKISADLSARFPTPEAAAKAGYLRYTDEDESGAISYANRHWTCADPAHPSQLWFDAKNRLIGADYSVPADTPAPPELFGVTPARWKKFHAHVHYGLAGPGGTIYGGAGAKAMEKAGATVDAPTKDALVAAGIAKKTADVRFVFTFPAIWDLAVWVIPNAAGAFADKNPDVKPVNPPKAM